MLEERLQDTKRFLERLASESGKSREEILKYLSQAQYNETDKLVSSDVGINEALHSKFNANQNVKNKRLQNKKSLFIDVTSGGQNVQSSEQSDSQKTVGAGTLLEKATQIIEASILQLEKISTLIMENVVEQMVTKKIYKIRQNFRDLILSLLGINEFVFYAFYESGRVEYQDFSSNFITQIMESDANYSILEKIIASATSQFNFVELSNNSDLMKLFQINQSQLENKKYYGLVTNQGSCQEESNFSFCLMIKSECKNISHVKQLLAPKLVNKIIEISQINTTQDSIYATSKNYMKKMLDLLQILLIQCEIRLKKALINQCKANKEFYYSITNIIKILLSKIDEHFANEQMIFTLRKLAGQFQEAQYKKIEETRMYKKYVREISITMLEFSRVGVLQFISGNKDNPYLNQLTRIWQEGKPVLDHLFGKNEKFDNYVKKAMRGSLKFERPLQITNYVKAKISVNGKRIQKIQITIEDSQGSNPDSNIEIPLPFTQKQNNIPKEKNEEKLLHMKTLNQIEREYPSFNKEGWLDLYLKGNTIKERHKSSSVSKKSNTLAITKIQTNSFNPKLIRQLSCVLPKQKYKVGMEDIMIDNPNLNFLTFTDQQLEYFAIKVLNSLDYFQRLPQEKAKLKNFISQLHDNYEVHSNPFHNFKHGINVMHTVYLLSTMPANLNILSVKDIFSNVFSGLCHDVGHTGFTNSFQIASMSRKAMIYNDRSPLENFHASLTFEILRKPANNFLCHMEREQFIRFRKLVIDNILYTDIKEHFPMLNNFNELLKSGKVLGKQDAPLLSAMIVHASDFAGSIKQFEICKVWSLRVNQQFSNQYKVEGEIGLPQTPFMKDLGNPIVLSKAEGGFLKVIVYPLYQALDKFYITEGIAHKFKKNIEDNIKAWEELNRIESEKVKALQKQRKKE